MQRSMPDRSNRRFHRSLLGALLLMLGGAALAQELAIPAPPAIEAKAYILIDAHSGRVLAEHNADERLPPASLTKIMQEYVVFHELAAGHLNLSDLVTISEKAWRTGGSRMFAKVHSQVSVEDLLKGVIVQSGNDASVALAEHIAGSEETFAELMNQHAARLGMTNSQFRNSMGLPDPEHYTSARDMATVTRALIREFPDHYPWHAIKEYTYNGIKQHNRNQLLWRDPTVDGVKTGHTEEAGYCLVASALRDGMRLISAVFGMSSPNARAKATQALLNYGFRFYETRKVYGSDQVLTEPRIYKGNQRKVKLGVAEDLYVTLPRGRYQQLKAIVELDEPIVAPFAKGARLGTVRVTLGEEEIQTAPLVAQVAVDQGNFVSRALDTMLMWLH